MMWLVIFEIVGVIEEWFVFGLIVDVIKYVVEVDMIV